MRGDRAILASKEVHATPRAGEGRASLPIINGIDSIDVTGMDASFLAHSYIGGVCVLGDIAQMICEGKPAASRLGIARRTPAGWRMIATPQKRAPRPCRVKVP